jgi:tRNA threonylcarbamoyl adenosine modification protein (Sua5/YciO/YrdC/YwlC family)
MLKSATPVPYTMILEATKEVPRRLSHPSRKTIGLRVPENSITQALLEELGEPLLGTTLMLPAESESLTDPEAIRELLCKQIELVIDGGACSLVPTTVVDLTEEAPALVRQGRGDASIFGL